MKRINFVTLLMILLSLLACNNDDQVAPDSEKYENEPTGEIIHQNIGFNVDNSGVNATKQFRLSNILEQEYDSTRIDHSYVTTGYTVYVDRAWVVDPDNIFGGSYEDLEFTDVDLNNQSIEFNTAGRFSVEVEHPSYKKRDASYEAYYGFDRETYYDWEDGETLFIDMELLQHAVFLVFRSLDIHLTIEEMEIDDLVVEEYQPVYIRSGRRYTIRVKHNGEFSNRDRIRADDSGTCTYFWVESIIFD